MTDLVKRLRASFEGVPRCGKCVEAADEIERLRAALEKIVIRPPGPTPVQIQVIAHEALGSTASEEYNRQGKGVDHENSKP